LKYGLPLGEYPFSASPFAWRTLGFIGNYEHLPNQDAARWLIQDLFPYLESQIPEAKLVLAGKSFPPQLYEETKRRKGIQVLGEVQNLEGFYSQIGVFINPIRKGRGLRTKLVEAAAFGKPILSTPLGLEGLETFDCGVFKDEVGVLTLLRAMGDPENYKRMALKNRSIVESEFSLEAAGAQLIESLGG
jgi:glycosyltransferase involved in cell wall biosynthesis